LSCFLTFLPPFALPAFLLGFTIAPEPKFTRRSVSRALESSHWCQSPWTRCVTAEAKIDFSLNNFLRRGGGGPTADRSVASDDCISEFRAYAQPVSRSAAVSQPEPPICQSRAWKLVFSTEESHCRTRRGGIGELVRFRIPIGPKGRSVLGLIRCCAGHRPFATVTWTARAVID